MADKERIQDAAAEGISGGKIDVKKVGQALGIEGNELVAEIGKAAEGFGEALVKAAKMQSNRLVAPVCGELITVSRENKPNVVGEP